MTTWAPSRPWISGQQKFQPRGEFNGKSIDLLTEDLPTSDEPVDVLDWQIQELQHINERIGYATFIMSMLTSPLKDGGQRYILAFDKDEDSYLGNIVDSVQVLIADAAHLTSGITDGLNYARGNAQSRGTLKAPDQGGTSPRSPREYPLTVTSQV